MGIWLQPFFPWVGCQPRAQFPPTQDTQLPRGLSVPPRRAASPSPLGPQRQSRGTEQTFRIHKWHMGLVPGMFLALLRG